jgi:cytochrome c oxidase cbb3-type subunit 2
MNKLVAIAGGSTLVYAVLASRMGVLPGIELSKVAPEPGMRPRTPIAARGRQIYVREGCAYCHTQQVRPLPTDSAFGRPSAPGDFAFDTPELLGSERTGPDLTNIGARQSSEIGQYIDLYDPRAVVPQSIMPSFPWLFARAQQAPPGTHPVPVPKPYAPVHGVLIPTDDAKALVAYLLTLKPPALPNAPSAQTPVTPRIPAARAAAPGVGGKAVPAGTFDAAVGATLFATNCAACHGEEGAGVPSVFPPLVGDPVVTAGDPGEHVTIVLHGLHRGCLAW